MTYILILFCFLNKMFLNKNIIIIIKKHKKNINVLLNIDNEIKNEFLNIILNKKIKKIKDVKYDFFFIKKLNFIVEQIKDIKIIIPPTKKMIKRIIIHLSLFKIIKFVINIIKKNEKFTTMFIGLKFVINIYINKIIFKFIKNNFANYFIFLKLKIYFENKF